MRDVEETEEEYSANGYDNRLHSPCFFDRITQPSPVLPNVEWHPNEMSKWNHKVGEWQIPNHWICLKHMPWQPKPNIRDRHCSIAN